MENNNVCNIKESFTGLARISSFVQAKRNITRCKNIFLFHVLLLSGSFFFRNNSSEWVLESEEPTIFEKVGDFKRFQTFTRGQLTPVQQFLKRAHLSRWQVLSSTKEGSSTSSPKENWPNTLITCTSPILT